MSAIWWESPGCQTTVGHGRQVQSSPRAEQLKQWFDGEPRRREPSPVRGTRSLNGSNLGATKSLAELRILATSTAPGPPSPKSAGPSSPTVGGTVAPVTGAYPPHQAHHICLGWTASTPQVHLEVGGTKQTLRKYGDAMRFSQDVHHKQALMTSRKA